jgi:hypothetical protein
MKQKQPSLDTQKNMLLNEILNTLSQKEERNFLFNCRRTTEGIVMLLASLKNIEGIVNSSFQLGDILRNDKLLKEIGIDINIKSEINYIRMLGNRASHYQKYKSSSTGEVNAAKESFNKIIEFFYNSIGEEVPKKIKSLILKRKKTNHSDLFEYNLDKNLYSECIFAIETSEKGFPFLGKKLLTNICSKIIIDTESYIPQDLYKRNYFDVDMAIEFIATKKLLSDDAISDLNAVNDAISAALVAEKYDKTTKSINENALISLKRITDSLFFKRYIERPDQSINAKLFFINLFAIFMGLASIVSFIYGAITNGISFNFNSFPVLVSVFIIIVVLYILSFSYELFYSALPSIRNKNIYNITAKIKEYGNITIVFSLYLVFNYFLKDGKQDTPFLPFYATTIIWLISLQLSNLFNERNTPHDKFIRFVTYLMLLFIGFMIYFIIGRFG